MHHGTYFSVASYRRKVRARSVPQDPWHAGGNDHNLEKPPIEVQVIVWVGPAILLAAVGAFVWLFMLGHGFNFPF